MPWGYGDTQFILFAEGQTDSNVRTMQNRAGINFLQFYRRVDAAVSALNQSDPLIQMLTYQTPQDRVRHGSFNTKVWQRSAEYTPGRPQLGRPGGGYLLPRYYYEIDLGYTRRNLMVMQTQDFEEELRTTVQAIARGKRADVLDRLFDPEEWPLDDDGNGASPGFAGSGTGTNQFFGLLPNGSPVDASYTHYFQMADTDAAIEAGINTMRRRLELWQRPPFDFIASPEMTERLTSIVGTDQQFVSAGSTLVRPGQAQSEALVDEQTYLGVFNEQIRVRHPERQLSGMSFAIFKPGGSNNPNNPLAWGFDPLFGVDAYVEERTLNPLAEAMVLQKYGIGVWRRSAATLGSVGGTAGVYAPAVAMR